MGEGSGETLRELGLAIRGMQSATEQVDAAARRGLGVNATDLKLLGILQLRGPLPPGVLAGAVGITAASTTVAVDRLCRRGLVSRGRDPDDGRRSQVALTPACARWLEQAYGPLRTEGTAMLARFTTEQLATIAAFVTDSTDLQIGRAQAITKIEQLP